MCIRDSPLDVARLLAAEQVASTTDLEVLHRHRHAGSELGVACDGLQAVMRRLGERFLGREQEVGVGPFAAAADPAPQLMQLRETEQVGALNDQRVGI